MKKVLISLINLYQVFLSVSIKNLLGISVSCRFSPTCSEYAKQSIRDFGSIRGIVMTLRRIAKCQPFYSIGRAQLN